MHHLARSGLAAHRRIYDHELCQPHLQATVLQSEALAGTLAQTLEMHRRILAAVRQRDGAGARRVMHEHLAQLRRTMAVAAGALDRIDTAGRLA